MRLLACEFCVEIVLLFKVWNSPNSRRKNCYILISFLFRSQRMTAWHIVCYSLDPGCVLNTLLCSANDGATPCLSSFWETPFLCEWQCNLVCYEWRRSSLVWAVWEKYPHALGMTARLLGSSSKHPHALRMTARLLGSILWKHSLNSANDSATPWFE